MIRIIRRTMPGLAALLLIGVYAVSAVAGGMFLARLMASLPGGIALAYSIGAAIQMTRASLVFFSQLNPTRPSFGFAGEVVAILMGVISIAEILSLVSAAGLAQPVAISLSILMAAGVGIELYLLREIKFSTEMELYSDRAHWGDLRSFYQARKEFKLFMEELADMESEPVSNSTRAAGNGEERQPHPDDAYDLSQTPMTKAELEEYYSGNGRAGSNGKHK